MWTKVSILYHIFLTYTSYVSACQVCPSNGGCFSEHSCYGTNAVQTEANHVSEEGFQIGLQGMMPHGGNIGGGSFGGYGQSGHDVLGHGIFGKRNTRCQCHTISHLRIEGDYYSGYSHFLKCVKYLKHEVELHDCFNTNNNGQLSGLDHTPSTEKITQTTAKVTTQPPTTSTETTTTTSTKTATTTVPVSTTLNIQSKQCSKMDTITRLAHNAIVKQSGLDCNDGIHGLSENVPMDLCGAPSSNNWIRGDKVIDNCSSIQKYSAVASFPGSNPYRDDGIAGVMVDCNSTYIKIATQDCNSFMQLVGISVDSLNAYSHNADYFYTIKW